MGEIKKKAAFAVIRVGKKLFYNTPVHRSAVVNKVYKKLFFSTLDGEKVANVAYFGHTFSMPTDDITILPSLVNNDYESLLLEVFTKLAGKGSTFADIGANVGIFSVVGSAAVGTKGKVFSFEPEPQNFTFLKKNISNNKLRNVQPENMAVGDKNQTLTLQIAKNSIGTHSLLSNRAHEIDHEIEVKVVTLDSYFTKAKTKVDIMKIDVEGYEPQVLRGAKKTLGNVKTLLFEYSKQDIENNSSVDELLHLLEGFPYIYCVEEKARRIKEFTNEDFYHTKYANILASKKPLNIEKLLG